MSVSETKELIRCSICNKIVPKQQYCPKCGKLLIKNMKNATLKDQETDNDNSSLENSDEESSINTSERLEKLRLKMKKSDIIRMENIEKESINSDLIIDTESEDIVLEGEGLVRNMESKDIVLEDSDPEDMKFTSMEEDKPHFKPDKYTLETVQKIAKNIKYESYLVNLLKDEEIAQDAFLQLYNGLADDTHKMILRREELISEIDLNIVNNSSIVSSAQQGMKLLNIRKSINDASDEEYKVKAAALKWDIDNYEKRIIEEDQKANYLKNLGSLIDVKELDKLTNEVHNCTNIADKLNIADKVKEKIQESMQEALAVLKEKSED